MYFSLFSCCSNFPHLVLLVPFWLLMNPTFILRFLSFNFLHVFSCQTRPQGQGLVFSTNFQKKISTSITASMVCLLDFKVCFMFLVGACEYSNFESYSDRLTKSLNFWNIWHSNSLIIQRTNIQGNLRIKFPTELYKEIDQKEQAHAKQLRSQTQLRYHAHSNWRPVL